MKEGDLNMVLSAYNYFFLSVHTDISLNLSYIFTLDHFTTLVSFSFLSKNYIQKIYETCVGHITSFTSILLH